ncbi:hypothetical protein BJV74DRAFT_819076 [Russula compacta]|nr:hypothetical protein BJV74DRAFT_819076 [Russula compacta]
MTHLHRVHLPYFHVDPPLPDSWSNRWLLQGRHALPARPLRSSITAATTLSIRSTCFRMFTVHD